jgi:hypothetical protein
MTYSAPIYESRGGAYPSITLEQYPHGIFAEDGGQDNYGTQTSSWNTSLVSNPPSSRRDGDYDFVHTSEMDLDSIGNVESVSTSPISNSTVPDDWINVERFEQLSQLPPQPLHQTPADTLWPMEQDNGILSFDTGRRYCLQSHLILLIVKQLLLNQTLNLQSYTSNHKAISIIPFP